MEEDMKEFNAMLDVTFPKKTVGEKQDLVIRQWLEYAKIHMEQHSCEEFRKILRIRSNQMISLLNS